MFNRAPKTTDHILLVVILHRSAQHDLNRKLPLIIAVMNRKLRALQNKGPLCLASGWRTKLLYFGLSASCQRNAWPKTCRENTY